MQLLQESLVGQWQEIGVHLLADIDSQLSAVTSLHPNHQVVPTIQPPSPHHNSIESPPRHLTPYLPVRGRELGQTRTPAAGTPFSQASYLIEDDDDRGEEEEGRGVELTRTQTQNSENISSTAGGSPALQHRLQGVQKYSNPLHSKSRILQKLPHHKLSHSQGILTNRNSGGEARELDSVAEQAESPTLGDPEPEVEGEVANRGVGDTAGEMRTGDMDMCETPADSGGTRQAVTEPHAVRDDEFGRIGNKLNSSTVSSGTNLPTSHPRSPVSQEKARSPTEPPADDHSWHETPSELEKSAEKPQSPPSHNSEEGEGERGVGKMSDRSKGDGEEGGGSDYGGGEGTEVLWTIGEPHASD